MRACRKATGFTLIEILITVALIGILAAIAIPNMFAARDRSKYSRAAADAKTAVSQALTYATEKGSYPTSMGTLRESGYASVADADPWGTPYVLAAPLASGGRPAAGDDIYIYSKGSSRTGSYVPGIFSNGPGGAAGYSSVYGSFMGQ